MSSFLYPNSATRKLFGQAGKALERQNKRFLNRLNAQEKEKIKQLAEKERITNEKAAAEFKRIQRKERITIAIIFGVVISAVVVYLMLSR